MMEDGITCERLIVRINIFCMSIWGNENKLKSEGEMKINSNLKRFGWVVAWQERAGADRCGQTRTVANHGDVIAIVQHDTTGQNMLMVHTSGLQLCPST